MGWLTTSVSNLSVSYYGRSAMLRPLFRLFSLREGKAGRHGTRDARLALCAPIYLYMKGPSSRPPLPSSSGASDSQCVGWIFVLPASNRDFFLGLLGFTIFRPSFVLQMLDPFSSSQNCLCMTRMHMISFGRLNTACLPIGITYDTVPFLGGYAALDEKDGYV